MSLQRLLLLLIPFMFFLHGTGLCEGMDTGHPSGMNQPIPDKVLGTCQTIAAILSVYPTLEVRKSEEPIRDLQGITERPGCRIIAFGPTWGIAGEIDPAEALRGHFQGTGWMEEIRYAADGPGTTSFAFLKNRMLCRVSGGAHSWIEDGKPFTSERYELEAWCASNLVGGGSELLGAGGTS
jgi:hypothetical protein